MQTFLPYADFGRSASVLDTRRLGKQRVEALQLLRGQWKNHPAAKMWKGYEYALAEYAECICQEWINRGYKDSCLSKVAEEKKKFIFTGYPPWLGNDLFHASHRSNLVRKNPDYYLSFFNDPPNLAYVWPS